MQLRTLALVLILSLPAACRSSGHSHFEMARVESEVRDTLRAFEAAEKTLDPEAVLRFIGPDFRMFQDGTRVGYEATVDQMRGSLPALRRFEPRFDDVEVIVLGPDAALTSMVFHDEITDGVGVTTRMWGPSTLLWRKYGDVWRIQFADSDHYPEP